MGGIVFVLVLVPVFAPRDLTLVEELFFLVAACAAIGFIDDLLSIRSGTNRGLSARTKFSNGLLKSIWACSTACRTMTRRLSAMASAANSRCARTCRPVRRYRGTSW